MDSTLWECSGGDGADFYIEEIEARSWYILFGYGDVMNTYDKARHCWRYDMGGYAWQNTELVPTLWLWYSFLRTGYSDSHQTGIDCFMQTKLYRYRSLL